jgi:hypothetical protein
MIGPGILVAVTGVGAGDLVATLIAGSRFGYALLWRPLSAALSRSRSRKSPAVASGDRPDDL